MTEPKIRKSMLSGRELFVCENMVEPVMVQQIGTLVKTLHYVRAEKSRADVPGGVAVCDIAPETIPGDTFLRVLRRTVEMPWSERDERTLRAWLSWSTAITLGLVLVLLALALWLR